ncbi:MAG: PDZ domain-containing protein [Candidimonas sp.]|jgi:predicted metalloprotease with PDZ domain
MEKEPLLYRVTPEDLAGHLLRVQLRIAHPHPQGQVLSLPAWIPGSYLIRDFSRQIISLQAECAAQPLSVQKRDSHTWQCEPCNGPLTIEYIVYAWDLSVRGAHVDESHAFFNGTSVFLMAHGLEHERHTVDLRAPSGKRNWQVYTSLPRAVGHPRCAREHGFGAYAAKDYDELIDHPVEMGTPQVVTFKAHGALHEMVFTGVAPNLDLQRIAADTRKICEAQIAFFEPRTRKAPFLDSADRYVFMTMATGDGYGGLEHRASTALMTSRTDLPVKGRAESTESYQNFLGLISHEYFHTWNVKRIKPAAFAPYRLDRETHTRLLWVFEGFTSYYDDLMLLRAGVVSRDHYLKRLARVISMVHRSTGRLKQSVAESSFDAWTRYYKQDENSPNALVSYYTKGSLVAAGLDLYIRHATNNRRSLDDAMRLLWTRYGRDFYRGRPTGIPEDGIAGLIREATGVDVAAFIDRYAHGREDVPLKRLMAWAGYTLQWTTPNGRPSLDVRTRIAHGETHLATVYEGGAAHRGGLSAGDVLVAIDGIRVGGDKSLDRLLDAYQGNDTVTVHVFRRDELRGYRVTLAPPAPTECRLTARESEK